MVKKTRVQKRRLQRRRKTQRHQKRRLHNKKRYVGGALTIYERDATTGTIEPIDHSVAIASISENRDNVLNMYLLIDDNYVPLVNYKDYIPTNNNGYVINEFWGNDIESVLIHAGITNRRLAELQSRLARANNADNRIKNAIAAYNSATNAWNSLGTLGLDPTPFFKQFILESVGTVPRQRPFALEERTNHGNENKHARNSAVLNAYNHLVNAYNEAFAAGFNPLGYIAIFSDVYGAQDDPPISILTNTYAIHSNVQKFFLNMEELARLSNEFYNGMIYPRYVASMTAAAQAPVPAGGAGHAHGAGAGGIGSALPAAAAGVGMYVPGGPAPPAAGFPVGVATHAFKGQIQASRRNTLRNAKRANRAKRARAIQRNPKGSRAKYKSGIPSMGNITELSKLQNYMNNMNL